MLKNRTSRSTTAAKLTNALSENDMLPQITGVYELSVDHLHFYLAFVHVCVCV